MNFLGIILVLVGVFALNDASISYDDQMLIINDQIMMEELKNMAMDRDANSIECSQELLDSLSQVMEEYNSDIKKCEKKTKNTIKSLNAGAMKIVDSYNITAQSSCEILDKCELLDLPLDALECYEEKGSDEAGTFSIISTDISTAKIKLQTDIEYALSAENVCTTDAFGKYSVQSAIVNANFSDCVNGKKPTATSVAPNESSENGEENDKTSGEEQ